ncbi:electron transport complex protein RnfA [Candidatus Magnetominusculus xianensis]|uniref:Ion-translocating oxidoreductase complex subunit A n=1 Tax=Candidatus Magnetominusculus xianensis TaxID=1748249 RepID=A0ABR5SJG5_9BACT|nr:Rnf-Nqr domain containing protein [Candidatus Magnetominusculus xianensis]KWT94611.1 Electron transport complex protein RnfA [Candidatus Magnetominusculus xianensis]MBF0403323.1 electron transport complex subunit RsxA [Nitrospirota bacterium]
MEKELTKLFEIFIASSLINNFVFTRFLGLCIFFGVTKKVETAVGMSITFTAVMMISAALSWVIFNFIMVPLDLTFLKIVIFIGVIAAFVQSSDTIMRKVSPGLYYKLGVYLALISTNCIILAVPLINAGEHYTFLEGITLGLGSGLGFALALVIMASIREKIEIADVPLPFKGLPISFVTTGLIALAFTGFAGIITS